MDICLTIFVMRMAVHGVTVIHLLWSWRWFVLCWL